MAFVTVIESKNGQFKLEWDRESTALRQTTITDDDPAVTTTTNIDLRYDQVWPILLVQEQDDDTAYQVIYNAGTGNVYRRKMTADGWEYYKYNAEADPPVWHEAALVNEEKNIVADYFAQQRELITEQNWRDALFLLKAFDYKDKVQHNDPEDPYQNANSLRKLNRILARLSWETEEGQYLLNTIHALAATGEKLEAKRAPTQTYEQYAKHISWEVEKYIEPSWDNAQDFGTTVPEAFRNTDLVAALTGGFGTLTLLKQSCNSREEYLEALRAIMANDAPGDIVSVDNIPSIDSIKNLTQWSSLDTLPKDRAGGATLQSVRQFILQYIKHEYNQTRFKHAEYENEPIYPESNAIVWQFKVGEARRYYEFLAAEINDTLTRPNRDLTLLQANTFLALKEAVELLHKPETDFERKILIDAIRTDLANTRQRLLAEQQSDESLVEYDNNEHLSSLTARVRSECVNRRLRLDINLRPRTVLPQRAPVNNANPRNHTQYDWHGEYTAEQINAIYQNSNIPLATVNDNTWAANLPLSADGFQKHAYAPVRIQDIGVDFFQQELLNYLNYVATTEQSPAQRRFVIPLNIDNHWTLLTVELSDVNAPYWHDTLKSLLTQGQTVEQQLTDAAITEGIKQIYASIRVSLEDSLQQDHYSNQYKATIEASLANAYQAQNAPAITAARHVGFLQTGVNCGKYVIEHGLNFLEHGVPLAPPADVAAWERQVTTRHRQLVETVNPQQNTQATHGQVDSGQERGCVSRHQIDAIERFVNYDSELELVERKPTAITAKLKNSNVEITSTPTGGMRFKGADDADSFKKASRKSIEMMLASQLGTKENGALNLPENEQESAARLAQFSFKLTAPADGKKQAWFQEVCSELGVTNLGAQAARPQQQPPRQNEADLALSNDADQLPPRPGN